METGVFSHPLTHPTIFPADESRKGKFKCLQALTHKHTCCRGNGKWQTGKRKVTSVSIYSSVGDEDEAGVRVDILHAARPIAWFLSLSHSSFLSRCASLLLLLLASSVKSLVVMRVISPETLPCKNTERLFCVNNHVTENAASKPDIE